MKIRAYAILVVILIPMHVGLANSPNTARSEESHLGRWVREATSPDPATAAQATAELRRHGESGLDALLRQHEELLKAPDRTRKPEWSRVRLAIEQVSRQRDAHVSRLFWHTELEQAKAVAQASGRPILSLRLLGNLNEEFTHANSRYFRVALYANQEVASYLRTHFVLHWKSVRPVPRVTIDFGDGRKLERTVTGNSIHYVLDRAGRPIDALPGLYEPELFIQALERAAAVARQAGSAPAGGFEAILGRYHETRLSELKRQFETELENAKLTGEPGLSVSAVFSATENPFEDRASLEALMIHPGWQRLSTARARGYAIDNGVRTLVAEKQPDAFLAGHRAFTKSIAENPVLRAIFSIHRSMAVDTLRNEYLLHARVHRWFSEQPVRDLEQLNRRVYAELFLTPDTDPWLGLVPSDAYSALENEGLVSVRPAGP